jgi:hypothetical protein
VLWLSPAGLMIAAIGTWRFATPTPRVAGSHGRWRASMLRIVGVATCTLQLQVCGMVVLGLTNKLRETPVVLLATVPMVLVAWSVAAGLTCLRAAYVAGQVRDRSGVIQARALSLLAPLTLLAFAWMTNSLLEGRQYSHGELVGWTVAACVVAGWSAVFFSGLALVVRRRAIQGEKISLVSAIAGA